MNELQPLYDQTGNLSIPWIYFVVGVGIGAVFTIATYLPEVKQYRGK